MLLCASTIVQQLKRGQRLTTCQMEFNNVLTTEEDATLHKEHQQQQQQQRSEMFQACAVSEPSDLEVKCASPVQITSIDGFFNRKRGRPPKNRFVEVYKSAQQSPQAIFTSFKLEKSDTSAVTSETATTMPGSTATSTSLSSSVSVSSSASASTTATQAATSTLFTSIAATAATLINSFENDLTHTRKRCLNAMPMPMTTTNAKTTTSTAIKAELASQPHNKYRRIKQQQKEQQPAFATTTTTTNATTTIKVNATASTTTTTAEIRKNLTNSIHQVSCPQEPMIVSSPEVGAAEKISIVRAAGTFYPQKSNRDDCELASNAGNEENVSVHRARPLKTSRDDDYLTGDQHPADDQPEDLSMKVKTKAATAVDGRAALPAEEEASLRLLQLKQLFNLYQQQLLLPGYLQTLLPQAANISAALSATEASAGPFDMRAFLEHAAKQKLLLFNIAAAAVANTAARPVPAEAHAQTNGVRRTRDHSTPLGYLKFRFNEDCGFEQCGYRNHQSHFHCNRNDCHYSFCDKTRFVQHTARHDRLDTLMGDDFQQFRANMHCGRPDCSYALPAPTAADSLAQCSTDQAVSTASRKSSHFHCRKCDYVCADTNKVVAHRRLHSKMEFIRSAGFRKVASHELCRSDTSCSYALKHTHYHCLYCDFSVLSRAQLAAHKHKTPTAATESDTKSKN